MSSSPSGWKSDRIHGASELRPSQMPPPQSLEEAEHRFEQFMKTYPWTPEERRELYQSPAGLYLFGGAGGLAGYACGRLPQIQKIQLVPARLAVRFALSTIGFLTGTTLFRVRSAQTFMATSQSPAAEEFRALIEYRRRHGHSVPWMFKNLPPPRSRMGNAGSDGVDGIVGTEESLFAAELPELQADAWQQQTAQTAQTLQRQEQNGGVDGDSSRNRSSTLRKTLPPRIRRTGTEQRKEEKEEEPPQPFDKQEEEEEDGGEIFSSSQQRQPPSVTSWDEIRQKSSVHQRQYGDFTASEHGDGNNDKDRDFYQARK